MNALDKLKAQAEASRKQAALIDRLGEAIDLGFTIEELREAITLYDRADGALVPSVAKVLPKTGVPANKKRVANKYQELSCLYCGDKFLSLRSNAIMCPKPECHTKRSKYIEEQNRIAHTAVDNALADGTLQKTLEDIEFTRAVRNKAVESMVKARDKGITLVAGDAIRAAAQMKRDGHLR